MPYSDLFYVPMILWWNVFVKIKKLNAWKLKDHQLKQRPDVTITKQQKDTFFITVDQTTTIDFNKDL